MEIVNVYNLDVVEYNEIMVYQLCKYFDIHFGEMVIIQGVWTSRPRAVVVAPR